MQGEMKERWQELCELATHEQDPATLLTLIQEINRILDEKQRRVEQKLKSTGR
jgi:hypothetical protein